MRKAVAAGSIVAAALVSGPVEAALDDRLVLVVVDEFGDDLLHADGNDTLQPPPVA